MHKFSKHNPASKAMVSSGNNKESKTLALYLWANLKIILGDKKQTKNFQYHGSLIKKVVIKLT